MEECAKRGEWDTVEGLARECEVMLSLIACSAWKNVPMVDEFGVEVSR
jgi:hypothetical protein